MSDVPPAAGALGILRLADVEEGSGGLVGGKAAGLAALIRAGERVPEGFCITTVARDASAGDGVREAVLGAYERLGGGAVAVRSSATTEDLPHASFAGQYETVLNVRGGHALLDAVRRCWESLSSPRAVAYRAGAGIAEEAARMAVVVQRMVDPVAAGVLFTANPITGCRTEMVVDAVAGLGDVVVEGSVAGDHYVLSSGPRVAGRGCLTDAHLDQLWMAGQRLQRRIGVAQDVEWAIDGDGVLWLLQARPITTLFPVPTSARPGARVFMEVGHMQGMLRPFTPMGMAAMRVATARFFASVGVAADPFEGHPGVLDAAGRMYLDITAVVRYGAARANLPAAMTIYGPRISGAVQRVLQDPRFSPLPGRPYRLRTVLAVAARLAPGLVAGMIGAIVYPDRARKRAVSAAAEVLLDSETPPATAATAADHLRAAMAAQDGFVRVGTRDMLAPIYAAMLARLLAVKLLAGVAGESEVDETMRGMPHNVTTEMDLQLWRLAIDAREHRDLLVDVAPSDLAARYLAGGLPEIGLGEFLRRYGHRGAAEIDVGLPRWAEDPTPVFAAIAGYLRVTDPEQAADRRFARAAAQANSKIDELVRRAARPVRGRCIGFLLRRCRAIAGLRELPKFAWLYAFAQMRRHLLAAGAELRRRGLLERDEDIMFLDLREAFAAADGADLRPLVTTRRAEYARERTRRSVPGLLLSDGTMPEALAPSAPTADGSLVGMAAAAGTATGRARVILDPADARVEPGEILVAPTTDPGWTPLFLTAAGLVTETGSPMAHGPTVAREYGIPAVICVRDATTLITTGQLISIDGAAGKVVLHEDPPADRSPSSCVGSEAP